MTDAAPTEPETKSERERERQHRLGRAAVAAQEHGWFENLTELDGEEEEEEEGA